MTVVKSDVVTLEDNLDYQVGQERGGFLKHKDALYTSSGAVADNTVILMHRIPVDANIVSMILNATDQGTTGDINIGFYKADGSTISDDSDAVDEDAIGSAIDVNAAAVSNTEVRYETKAITTKGDKAWELAGLSARPSYEEFYVALTLSEATTAAGTFTLDTFFI